MYDEDGTKLVSYTYDAYGNFDNTYHNGGDITPVIINPFMYRGYYWDRSLYMYVTPSRYYDAHTGRWLNADSYVSTGQGLTGCNMYAYCGNNPIKYVDPMGLWTVSIGVNGFAFLIGGLSYNFDIVIDGKGNIALQKTKANVIEKKSGGVFGVVNAGVGVNFGGSNASTVYELEGESFSASVGYLMFGISAFTSDIDNVSNSITGGSLSFGLSAVPVDVHVTADKTETVSSFNIIEYAKRVWEEICSWFV